MNMHQRMKKYRSKIRVSIVKDYFSQCYRARAHADALSARADIPYSMDYYLCIKNNSFPMSCSKIDSYLSSEFPVKLTILHASIRYISGIFL